MDLSLRYAATRWLGFVAKSLFLIILLAAVFMFGPGVQESLFPVLTDQVVTVIRAGNEVTFKIAIVKRYACRIETIGWEIYDDVGNGLFAHSPIDVKSGTDGSTMPTVSYAPGHIVTGPFHVTLPPGWETADVIEGILYYACPGVPWSVRQIFGPVQVPPKASG